MFDRTFNNSLERPLGFLGRQGQYLSLANTDSSTAIKANLVSTCIDLSALSNPELSFHLYSKIGSDLSLNVMVKETNQPWVNLMTITGSVPIRSSMQLQQVSLNAYQGQEIQLALEVVGPAGYYDHEIALDQIMIKDKNQTDLGLTSALGLNRLPANAISLPIASIGISNNSTQAIHSPSIGIAFYDLCNTGGIVYTGQVNQSVIMGTNNGTTNISGLTLNDSIPSGRYQARMWLHTPGDTFHLNDTLYFETVVAEEVGLPYYNDFEACHTRFVGNGELDQWELTTPAGGAKSGSLAFETNADGTLISTNNGEVLIPPFLSGLDTLRG
ncbi:MAG: hypothetical protein U5L96_08340 [Owenweeksia sp.]|nr:hypothetical protein [Owenweeksia sp.]